MGWLQLAKKEQQGRVWLLDEIRGFSILGMVLYHGVYDLVFIFGIDFPFFYSPLMNGVRTFFAGVFIFISGCACRFSHSNLRRGAVCFGLGMAMTVVTLLVIPSEAIFFGVLHCLGLCMLIFGLAKPLLDKLSPLAGLAVWGVLFFLLYRLPAGAVGIPYLLELPVPSSLYATPFLFPLGLPSAGFFSSDYFPLIPWLLLFLAGSYAGVWIKEGRFPQAFYRKHCPFLVQAGQHTLLIYVLHQPVLYGLMWLLFHAARWAS